MRRPDALRLRQRRPSIVGLCLIFQIAKADLVQPLAAEFVQQQIEIASGLAEFRITRIAQTQNGEADRAQIGGFFAVEEFYVAAKASSGGSPSPWVDVTKQ